MTLNSNCFAMNVAPEEESRVIDRVVYFAWDDELIRAARVGPILYFSFWEPLSEQARRKLQQVLDREIAVACASVIPAQWRTVHEFDLEN